MKDRTRLMFASELEKMLATMPMDKVRVVELCRRCGATPPTFYYYFHDKYELVAWIFLRDFAAVFADRQPEYSAERIAASLKTTAQKRQFYQQAYSESGQNSIDSYVQHFNVSIASESVKQVLQQSGLSKQQMLAVRYHSYGMMGLFKEWLNNDSKISLEDLAEFQYQMTPEFLKKAFQEYRFSSRHLFGKGGQN
ncbi:TetR/AcrR family transcriptional regulator C-terminal domain-containing protein [Secundilactobacillus folii]|nr:TetR/AcrR family transcriptional regulator C-terminal domain-containing protein [Secundilactobacillus folii]